MGVVIPMTYLTYSRFCHIIQLLAKGSALKSLYKERESKIMDCLRINVNGQEYVSTDDVAKIADRLGLFLRQIDKFFDDEETKIAAIMLFEDLCSLSS